MSEIRYCRLYNKEVIFAPKRLKRKFFTQTMQPPQEKTCVFDAGNEDKTPHEVARIQKEGSWRCRVVPNLYNALSIEKEGKSIKDGFEEKKEGFGAHEVVIETPHHHKDFFNFEKDEFFDYFTILKNRVLSLQKDIRLNCITIFKNHGFKAGSSMHHSHSQIIATPQPLNSQKEFVLRQKEYFKSHGRTLLDDIIYDELQTNTRVIHNSSDFFVYAPYASQFGYELIIVSKNVQKITQLNQNNITALSEIFYKIFQKYDEIFGKLDFNLIFNEQMNDLQEYTNFFIKITPRFNMIAGFEIASTTYINPFLPEEVAKKMS